MSIILDALKKLDHKQKHGSVPDLLAVQEHLPQRPDTRPLWPYLLFAGLVLNAAVVLVWFGPWQERDTAAIKRSGAQPQRAVQNGKADIVGNGSPAETAPTTIEHEKTAAIETLPGKALPIHDGITAAAGIDGPRQKKSRPARPPDASEHLSAATTEKQSAANTATAPVSASPAVQERSREIPSSPVTRQYPGTVPPDTDNGITVTGQLPDSIAGDLPSLTITGHIFSNDPFSRVVNINGNLFREGESVHENLTLEEITPSGVILNYQGHRFNLRAF